MTLPLADSRMPSTRHVGPLDEVARGLFFIVGCGRSGTTLLQVMLASHPDITLPNETGFYSLLRRKYLRKWGELGDAESFRAAFDATLDFWRIRPLGVDRERVWELARGGKPSWETLFLALLAALAEERGASRVGEKSPGHFRYLPLLAERFPDAKFIHMIRDARGVVGSYHSTFGIRSIGAKIRRWKEAIRAHREHGPALGDRYMTVKYEDLVLDPESVLRGVCAFLGCSFSPAMLTYHERGELGFAPSQMHHMANTLRPVFTSSLDKWRSQLSHVQIALVEHLVGRELEELGYALTGARTRFPAARYGIHLAMDLATRGVDRVRTSLGLEPLRRRKR